MAASMAFAGAVPALGAVSGDYTGQGIYIRRAATTGSTADGMGYKGQGITVSCVALSGTNVNGTRYWDRHKNRKTGVKGYSTEYYTTWSGALPSTWSTTCTPAP
jgi:hypothetical protein